MAGLWIAFGTLIIPMLRNPVKVYRPADPKVYHLSGPKCTS